LAGQTQIQTLPFPFLAAFSTSQWRVALLGITQRTIHVTFGPKKHPENCSKQLQIKT
jgi:hypothetical protein